MAWASGTATDFIDFLRKLRDYATGVIDPAVHATINAGVVVPLADRWVAQTNGASQPNIPASGFATDGEVYLIGPGSDVDDEIIVGFKTYRNAGSNIFGWEIKGFTAFDDTLTFSTMPGASTSALASFDDAAFNVHFRVNNRRIIAVAVIGSAPVLVHAGFIQQFFTRGQYPYPLLISGSVRNNTTNSQSNTFAQSSLPDPCYNGAFLRWMDGEWLPIRHYLDVTSSSRPVSVDTTDTGVKISPHKLAVSLPADTAGSNYSEGALFDQYTDATVQISSSEISSHALIPCVLNSSTQLIGRLDGMVVVSGLGIATGDTVTDAEQSPDVVYDVFANTWRTDTIDFYALSRE